MIVVISDLCDIMNIDLLARGIKLCLIKGHRLRFVVPFTPAFYAHEGAHTEKYDVLKRLFTSAEKEERLAIIDRLRAMGVEVEIARPARRSAISQDSPLARRHRR